MSAAAPSVAVIGLGSIGSMALWQLARRGANVTGFEQFDPGHELSAHGGETRIFRTAYLESPDYVPLLLRARELWRELEFESRARLLNLNGVLTIGSADTATEMSNIWASSELYGLDVDELPIGIARERYPHLYLEDDEIVVLDRQGGYLRPELGVFHACRCAQFLGATIHRYTRVTAVVPDDRGVTVRCGDDEGRFDKVVVATGPWVADLLGQLGYPRTLIKVRRLLQAWFDSPHRELFLPERCPVFIRLVGARCYGIPAMRHSAIKVGLSSEESQLVDDPDELKRTVGAEELDVFRQRVARALTHVRPEPIEVSAYMDGYTPDNHGIVGPLPGMDRVILLAGFSGHGFKLAPAFGEIGADAALGRSPSPTISQVIPARLLA